MTVPPPDFLSVAEAAVILNVSEMTVRRRIDDGDLCALPDRRQGIPGADRPAGSLHVPAAVEVGTVTPYYEDESVVLYHGDCREIDAWLEADVLVTDPPYGIGWKRGRMNNAHGKEANVGIQNDADTVARDAALDAWGKGPALVFGSLRAAYPPEWHRMLVFEKPVVGSGLVGVRMPWPSNWEPIFCLGTWPDQTPRHSAVVRTRWASASGYSGYTTQAGHSHAKPLDVMEALIEACPPGVIADPFAGSGSTLVAARNLGRHAVGVELDERYCELIANRLAQGALDFGGVA